MFGDDDLADSSGRVIRVCCGPRCGAESDHRRIYNAVEKAIGESLDRDSANSLSLRPVMCQGYCGLGVTLVMPDGEKTKIRAPIEARQKISTLGGY